MKKISETVKYQGRFLSFKEMVFVNKNGAELTWECLCRAGDRGGVVIVARLIPSQRYVFIRQFRPAINNVIVGFPAGLVDCDDLEKNALRELKEETGYTGKLVSMSPELRVSAGVMLDRVHMALVTVDENDPVNRDPQQDLEPEEQIEVVLVAADELEAFLHREREKGYEISAALWQFLVAKSF